MLTKEKNMRMKHFYLFKNSFRGMSILGKETVWADEIDDGSYMREGESYDDAISS